MAESAVPIRRTKPQLQLFIPWCARGNWHERLYESMSRTTIRDRPLRRPLIHHSRHPFVNPAPQSSFRRRPESRGVGEGQTTANLWLTTDVRESKTPAPANGSADRLCLPMRSSNPAAWVLRYASSVPLFNNSTRTRHAS